MSFRYEVTITNEKTGKQGYVQLFGNNEYIPELHEFASKVTGEPADGDGCFETKLNSKQLNELYKVVDNVCLEFNKESKLVIDVEKMNRYDMFSFGENLMDVILGNYKQLQSAVFYKFLLESKGTEGYSPKTMVIKDCYSVEFSYG